MFLAQPSLLGSVRFVPAHPGLSRFGLVLPNPLLPRNCTNNPETTSRLSLCSPPRTNLPPSTFLVLHPLTATHPTQPNPNDKRRKTNLISSLPSFYVLSRCSDRYSLISLPPLSICLSLASSCSSAPQRTSHQQPRKHPPPLLYSSAIPQRAHNHQHHRYSDANEPPATPPSNYLASPPSSNHVVAAKE